MGCRHLFRPRRTLDLDLNVSGNLDNLGTLAGRQLVSLTADNLNNLGGRISGKALDIATLRDFNLQGGSLDADDQLAVRAGRNITIESTTRSAAGRTHIDRIAALYVNNPGGTLQLEANGDIGLLAAYLINNAPTAAGVPAGKTVIDAGHNLTLGTVTTAYAEAVGDGKHARQESGRSEIGSTLQATGDITLTAGNDLAARAADVSSEQGRLLAVAGNDLLIEAGEASTASAEQHKYKSKGFLSKSTTTTRDTSSDTTAIASTFSGDSTTLIADRDIAIKGSNVVATNDTTLIATRNLSIEAATETHNETHYSKTKQSGIFSSGGVGFTIGSKQNSSDQKTDATLAARSTVGSTDGNVLLLAGETYKQVGSDVIAAKGDIDIAAKQVDIKEARETSRTITETKSKQSGFTVAFTSPIITAVQTAQQMSEAAKDTSDPRMKALAAASTGLAGYNAYSALEAGQGITTPDGKTNQILSGKTNPDGSAEYRDATAADKMGGVGINLSIGGSKSSSTTTQSSDTAAVSNLTAGRDIRIEASGAGSESDLTLQGTKATAARNLTLTAEDEIRLLAAKNTSDQHSTNKNSSASVGIGFMVGGTQNGFTIQAGVSGGKGKADGQDVSHSNTHVTAGDTLTLKSGGDTTMKGAVAKGEQVKADIGKDLLIESLQDTSTYDSQQKSLGVSVSLCIPPFCYGTSSGSVSASDSKVNSDYASVTEQSAIRAGDKGFDVDVKGDTDLKGSAITSTQKAIDDQRNQFKTGGELTTSDIENKAEYKAKSASVNVGTGFSAAGKLMPGGTSAGFGKDGDKAESMTLAAISDIAGNKGARTGDAETGIAKIFDQEKVQKEIDAQVKITQMFGQLAPKAAADFAKTRQDALNEQAKLENDPAKKAELQNEAKQWGEGGAYRVALHTVIGGLAGGTSGALGAGASAAAAPLLNELQDSIASALKGAGANDSVAKLAGQLISGATAAGIGAAAGGTQGAMTAFNADANNRQLHPDEAAFIKRQARAYAARNNMSEEDAERTLMRGALYANDADWQSAYQKYTPEEVAAYQQAAAYLTAQATASGFVFTNPEGQMQAGFTSTASQFANERYLMRQALTDTQTRSMYSDRAAIALGEMSTRNQFGFGKQAVTGFGSGIADGVENALKGYAGLVDPATYGKLVDAAKTLAADPSGTIRRLADGLKGGAQDAALNVYLDYLQKDSAELGKTAGAIFGQALVDVAATASGIAVVKNAGRIGEGVADIQAAVARRVAVEIDKTATEALLRSGGAFDKAGNPLLDMSKLSNDQKRVMGEQLFGPNTIKQIVPDGQQIARMQGPGSTGIDDLYKVNRPDVDYVVVEYKFVGQDNKTGAQVLGSTADGKQGSDSWVLGSGRLEKAVGIDNARDVLASTKTGRMEMWVVTTRPDGSTIVEVLDALGKPKPTDTSRILTSGLNLSGARP